MLFWTTRTVTQLRQLAGQFNASEQDCEDLVDAFHRYCHKPCCHARVRHTAHNNGARRAAIDTVIAMARYDKQCGDLTSSHPRGAMLTWFMAKYFSTRNDRIAA